MVTESFGVLIKRDLSESILNVMLWKLFRAAAFSFRVSPVNLPLSLTLTIGQLVLYGVILL